MGNAIMLKCPSIENPIQNTANEDTMITDFCIIFFICLKSRVTVAIVLVSFKREIRMPEINLFNPKNGVKMKINPIGMIYNTKYECTS